MNNTLTNILLCATVITLGSSCAKNLSGNGNENYLSFSSNIAEIVKMKSGAGVQADTDSPARFVTLSSADGSKSLQMELSVEPNTSGLCGSDYAGTKAALQISASSFTTAGFNGSQKWFPKTGDTQTVTTGTPYNDYLWVDGTSYNFFAYANVPSGMTATITSSSVSLSGNVADAAAGQTDVLLGRFSGQGAGGKAFVNFYHPMTAVIFKVGDLDATITAVKSISIDGVYASGSTTLATGTGTPTFTWSNTSSKKVVSQKITGNLPSTGSQIGTPFVLIPQNLATQNVTVNLIATTADGDILLTTTLDTGSWEAGKTYTYKVNYVGGPDPNYWVDLGMVSQNGHKLYVAAYDVESIDANGNITFADTDGKTALTTKKSGLNGRSEFTAPGDIPCRLMAGSEAKDCFLQMVDFTGNTATAGQNKNITWNSGTGTSLITGKSISFSINNYLVSDNNVKYVTIGASSNTFNMYESSSSRLRMVYEDTSITYEVKNAIVYGFKFDQEGGIYELKDWSIEQKEWQLGLDFANRNFGQFDPIIEYNGTSFVSQSIIDITSSTSWSTFDVYCGYFLSFSGTSIRTVQISYAIDKTLTLHIYGSRGID